MHIAYDWIQRLFMISPSPCVIYAYIQYPVHGLFLANEMLTAKFSRERECLKQTTGKPKERQQKAT